MARTASDWITLAEAAEILGAANVHVRPETLGRWARTGRLQTLKIGGRRYVRRAEVRALLRPRRRVAAEALQPGLFEEL
jgi:predicted site-specific integrase-resolvase